MLLDESTVRVLLLVLDLAGTFVFAISGAMLGVRRRLDIFGVLVLSFVAASAGGIVRDLLIGAVPPAAIRDWRYFGVAAAAGLAIFFWHPPFYRLRHSITLFDAAGLALFAVAGAQKALAFDLHPVMAVLLGTLTGTGGGVARDLLLARTPALLRRREVYASAAMAGAAVVVVGHWQGTPRAATAISGAVLCFVLRLLAIRLGWGLPVARERPGAKPAGRVDRARDP